MKALISPLLQNSEKLGIPGKNLKPSPSRFITQNDLLNLPIRKPPTVKGIQQYMVGTLIKLNVLYIAIRLYFNPIKIYKVLKGLSFLRKQYLGDYKLLKLFKIRSRYYWDMHAPGWPSKAFTKYTEGEMNRIISFRPLSDYLNSMILAITKKCPLNCEHCYEWNVINRKEKLSQSDLISMVRKFQDRGKGVAQIQFSGGEPLSRYSDILQILYYSNSDTDFWIVTSGYYLSTERAKELRSAGLKGFAFSLDHFDSEKHNKFRGSRDSYYTVIKAIEYTHQADLAVILSLCVTKEFTSSENLMKYAEMAKTLGVSFILLIEPRASGRYEGKEVGLTDSQILALEDFYVKMNFNAAYLEYPAVSYHGYHQRRVGCFGGTNRYIYVNTDGEMQACPFCQQTYGTILNGSAKILDKPIMINGCKPFRMANL